MSGHPIHDKQKQFATNHVIIAPGETSALISRLRIIVTFNHTTMELQPLLDTVSNGPVSVSFADAVNNLLKHQ